MTADPQIHTVVQHLGERWNAYDANGLALLFAPDADLTNAFGMAASGRGAIERFHAALFSSVFKDSRFHLQATRLRWIRPDVVTVNVRWSVTGMHAREKDPRGDLHGLMALVLTPHADEWLITTMHIMQFPSAAPTI